MPIKLHVEILVPDEAPKEFDLQFSGPQVTLGRDRSNDVHVALSTLSRRHARIFERDRQWFIEDLE